MKPKKSRVQQCPHDNCVILYQYIVHDEDETRQITSKQCLDCFAVIETSEVISSDSTSEEDNEPDY